MTRLPIATLQQSEPRARKLEVSFIYTAYYSMATSTSSTLEEKTQPQPEEQEYQIYLRFKFPEDQEDILLTQDLTYGGKSDCFGKGTIHMEGDKVILDTCWNALEQNVNGVFDVPNREERVIIKLKNEIIDEAHIRVPEPVCTRDSEYSDYDEEEYKAQLKDKNRIGEDDERIHTTKSEEGNRVTVHYFGRRNGMPRITQIVWDFSPSKNKNSKNSKKSKKNSNKNSKKTKINKLKRKTISDSDSDSRFSKKKKSSRGPAGKK